jgi:TGF-beta propeptide
MRTLVVLVAAFALSLAQGAAAATVTIEPSADTGLPFWCDWGYDWEERCYADHGRRLPVGGVDDKVWRSALRFPLSRVPEGASITSAELRLRHDGTCVAPRLRSVACEAGSYWLDAHRILTADWFDEREPELDERVAARAILSDASAYQVLSFDLTGLVRDWHRRLVRNDGVLIQLTDWQEGYGVSGPYIPSSSFADVSLRPVLVVAYTPAGP